MNYDGDNRISDCYNISGTTRNSFTEERALQNAGRSSER